MRKGKSIDDKRGKHPSSQLNLKLGAISRDKNKIRRNFSILPETHKLLHREGNASELIDVLVHQYGRGLILTPQKKEKIIDLLNRLIEKGIIWQSEVKTVNRIIKLLG